MFRKNPARESISLVDFLKAKFSRVGYRVHKHSMIDYGDWYYVEPGGTICLGGILPNDATKPLAGFKEGGAIEIYGPVLEKETRQFAKDFEKSTGRQVFIDVFPRNQIRSH